MAKENSEQLRAGKKRKQRYLPHNKPAKKRNSYPLRPGVQGFFITCDGGREQQAAHEAINIIDSFYEELVHGRGTNSDSTKQQQKPLNKRIRFTYSDEEEDSHYEETKNKEEKKIKETNHNTDGDNGSDKGENGDENGDEKPDEKDLFSKDDSGTKFSDSMQNITGNCDNQDDKTFDLVKNENSNNSLSYKNGTDAKAKSSVDELIEEELMELGDRSKRLFISLDSGCNGVIFIQMRKRDGDPSPTDVVKLMMTSAASTKKHMSRFLLRVLPVEVACYSSEEEISQAIAPLVTRHFPLDAQEATKFAVLYEARANTGINRTSIIDAVAKSVPSPHKVDLSNPEKTIIVEIAKTVCLIGVAEKYKELSKFNLRQLASQENTAS